MSLSQTEDQPQDTRACMPDDTPCLVDYDTAQALLTSALQTLLHDRVDALPPLQACGRVLAEDVQARSPRPEVDISAMDGYAFRAGEMQQAGAAGLPVRGYVAAGTRPAPLAAGAACEILTGARIPDGADCVVARERTAVVGGRVVLAEGVSARTGTNIRWAGEEFEVGQCLLKRGTSLDWRHMPLLLDQGKTAVRVYRPLSVSVLANGAEFGCQAEDGRTELNTHMLEAMLRSETVRVTREVSASDSPDELENALHRCLEQADVVVTTGGISVGQTDHVLPVLQRMGASCLFRRVRMRPGKPMTVMRLGRTVVFCLPGNPGAAALCAQLFVTPFLAAMSGRASQLLPRMPVTGRSGFAYAPPPDATCFLPVSVAGEGDETQFSLVPSVGASDIQCLTRASGVVRVDAGRAVQVGDWTKLMPFSNLSA
jgi:molybdopterin molybdotransferase